MQRGTHYSLPEHEVNNRLLATPFCPKGVMNSYDQDASNRQLAIWGIRISRPCGTQFRRAVFTIVSFEAAALDKPGTDTFHSWNLPFVF